MWKQRVSKHFDIAVIGSGFAGPLMAMVALRLGHSVVLIERGSHPRVVIGESSTPLANLLLEELADRYELTRLRDFSKWGTWQKNYPHVSCGLKRGFSFFKHELDRTDDASTHLNRQLLVAASPHDGVADTHWFRADFDHFLVNYAQEIGVDYFDNCEIRCCEREHGQWILRGERKADPLDITATFLIDATGPRGFLHRTLRLGEEVFPGYPTTSALFAHFADVQRLESLGAWPIGSAPYAHDDAALHHIFNGGWLWVLRFNNGWTSAGVAATKEMAERFHLAEGEPAWYRLLDSLPLVKEQFASAQARKAFTYLPRISFLSSAMAGDGWAMLPTAAGFVDPLLSTGIPLALLGIGRLGRILSGGSHSTQLSSALQSYAADTRGELIATADLIGALYANMDDFPLFRTLSLLYFAAASFSESARRLEKHELVRGFLLHDDLVFAPECRRLLAIAKKELNCSEKAALVKDILALVAQFDVAGLCDHQPDSCYPVVASDLLASADKLNATREEIDQLLERSGFLLRRSV